MMDSFKKDKMESYSKFAQKALLSLPTTAVFVPHVHYNRTSLQKRDVRGIAVLMQTLSTQLSDVRDDEARSRVLHALRHHFRATVSSSTPAIFVISNVNYDDYLNSFEAEERRLMAAFPRPRDLPVHLRRGKFDLLIISRGHGVVICEVKSVGEDFVKAPAETRTTEVGSIRQRLKKAVRQLNKAETVLRHLLSDICKAGEKVPVRKVLVCPNLSRVMLETVAKEDATLQQEFCDCFHARTFRHALDTCMYADQLPPAARGREVTPAVLDALRTWWTSVTSSHVDDQARVSDSFYETLIARLCGPGTNSSVKISSEMSLVAGKTPHDAAYNTARLFEEHILLEEQASVLEKDDNRVFLSGPPGTGKSVVLLLKGQQRILEGHDVYVVSLWPGSDAVSYFIVQQIRKTLPDDNTRDKVKYVSGSIEQVLDILRKAVAHDADQATKTEKQQELDRPLRPTDQVKQTNDEQTEVRASESPEIEVDGGSTSPRSCGQQKSGKGESTPLLLLDEAPWFFPYFLKTLDSQFGEWPVWAASVYRMPRTLTSFTEVTMTRGLRCPPTVVREVKTGPAYAMRAMAEYCTDESAVVVGLPPQTDGPPVLRISHASHRALSILQCETCGHELGQYLTQFLQIGTEEIKGTEARRLRFRDVLISGHVRFEDDDHATAGESDPSAVFVADVFEPGVTLRPEAHRKCLDDVGKAHDLYPTPATRAALFRALVSRGLPLEVIGRDDPSRSRKLATPTDDVMQVAEPQLVVGLERDVVVYVGSAELRETFPRYVDPWLDVVSRCRSQLIVLGDLEGTEAWLS